MQLNTKKSKFSFDSNVLAIALKEDVSIFNEITNLLLELIFWSLKKRSARFLKHSKSLQQNCESSFGWRTSFLSKCCSIASVSLNWIVNFPTWRLSLYDEFELDFIFYVLLYVSLDEEFDKFNSNSQTIAILTEIISAYSHDQWQIKVGMIWLLQRTVFIYFLSTKKNEFRQNITQLASKHYHMLVYLNSYFDISHNERIRDLSFAILFDCIVDLLESKGLIEPTVDPKSQVSVNLTRPGSHGLI